MKILPLLLFLSFAPDTGADAQDNPKPASTRIEFLDSLDQAKRLAADSGLPIALIFGAVWCSSCRQFRSKTLPSVSVQSMAAQFHWVYVEIERELSLARSFGVSSTPQFVVIDAGGTRLGTAEGALNPMEMLDFLHAAQDRSNSFLHTQDAQAPSLRVADLTPLTWSPSGFRAQSVCFSHVGYGPLNVPSQSPAQILRLGLRPHTPSTLARGQYQVRWTESVANIFAYREGDFRLDYLTINSIFALAYGVSDTFQVELEYNNVTRTNSALDPITDAFHDALGLGDSGRDDFDSQDNTLFLAPKNGISINSDEAGSESSDVTLTLQHNITCGTETLPAISYALDLRYHAGGAADLEGETPFSVGLSSALARRLGSEFYTYAALGYAWHGQDEARGLPLNDSQWSGLMALEWRYGARSSWIIQYLVSEGVARDRDPFNKAAHEINLGWKREVSTGTVFEISLIENIIEADNSPDFGVHFGLQYRF